MPFLSRRLPVVAAATLPLTVMSGLLVAPAVAATDPPQRAVLADTKPDFATAANDKGKVADATTVDLHIYLGVKDPDDLAAQAKAVSDPKSGQHGKYLTADQIRQRYQLDGPSMAAVDAWLAGAGLTPKPTNWRYLSVTATAAQFAAAFNAELHTYTNGTETDIAPNADLSVPAALADQVLDVSGMVVDTSDLTNPGAAPNPYAYRQRSYGYRQRMSPLARSAPGAPTVARPAPATTAADENCSESWGAKTAADLPPANGAAPGYELCGYNSADVRGVYDLTDGQTGKGQTVAVLGAPPASLAADVTAWSKTAGVPAPTDGQLSILAAPDGTGLPDPAETPDADTLGAYQDSTLAVEAVHALAPDAKISVVAPSDADNGALTDSLAQVIDGQLANIVTGQALDDVGASAENVDTQLLAEGALAGVSFVFPSGDDGQFAYPASDPWATAVGGTATAVGADGAVVWQTGWADLAAPLSADKKSWGTAATQGVAGGGREDDFDQPWYQQGVVPDKLAKATDGKARRVGPDVAMLADPVTGLLVGGTAFDEAGKTYTEESAGGTVEASALFAGYEAIAQQVSGKAIGFANPTLYAASGTAALTDVTAYQDAAKQYPVAVATAADGTTPTLVTVGGAPATDPNAGSGPATTPGFDEITGLGVPTAQFLTSLR